MTLDPPEADPHARDVRALDSRMTERRNPRSHDLDRLDVRAIVDLIQSEDRRVPEAVAAEA